MTSTNWDQELKRIEREFQGLSPDPVIKLDNARAAAEKHAQEQTRLRNSAIGVWVRVLLVVALGVAMWYWPYARACGVGLYAYVGAAGLIAVSALWAATTSWASRMATAHVVAMVMLIGALTLLAANILPRAGYITITGTSAAAWRCPATPTSP